MTLLSTLLSLTAIALSFKSIRTIPMRVILALLCFFQLFLLGFYFVADHLTGSGVNESVLYHLNTDMEGAGLKEFSYLIALSTAYLLSILLMSTLLYRKSYNKNHIKPIRYSTSIAVFIAALATNPTLLDIGRAFYSNQSGTPPDYIDIKKASLPESPKNLVFIYLESLERTYFNERIFPNLLPELSALEQQAISFTDIRQAYGTGWTIAGITASQCGVPLITPANGNAMGSMDQFLPRANCLGDLLSKHNYELNYLGGAHLNFAGKGRFYKTHNFQRIEGLQELHHTLKDPLYTSSWGLFDDTLYDLAYQRFEELSTKNQPFGLFMLTLDTHHPSGLQSSTCKEVQYADGKNPMLNAVHCADRLASSFIRRLLSSKAADNTIIVVASDHLAMQNTASGLLNQSPRRNLLMMFAPNHSGDQISKPGSTLDTGPTILQLLGSPIRVLGMGRSLLEKNTPTLTEAHASLDDTLTSYRNFFKSLWSFPQLEAGITVQPNSQKLFLGQRVLDFPALILLNADLHVREVRFPSIEDPSLSYQVSDLAPEQLFILVDHCPGKKNINPDSPLSDTLFCMSYGALGADEPFKRLALREKIHFSKYQLEEELLAYKARGAGKLYAEQRQQLLFLDRYGTADVIDYDSSINSSFTLVSSSSPSGNSRIETGTSDMELSRGLTLIGLGNDQSAVVLQHQDTCEPYRHQEPLVDSFQNIMNRESFQVFAVIAHDSAWCRDKEDMRPALESTNLEAWQTLEFRVPYIAIIDKNRTQQEFLGSPNESLVIRIN